MIISVSDGTPKVQDVLYEIEPEQMKELLKVFNHYYDKNITFGKLIDKFRIKPSAIIDEWKMVYGDYQIEEIKISFVNNRIILKRKENENE